MMPTLLCLTTFLAAPPAPADAADRSVAVFKLEAKIGVPAGAADLLTDNLLSEIRGSGAFGRVVSPAEIAVLMPPEQQSFLIKCASDECALVDNELAGALGVSHIVVGNLGKLGNSYLLNLRLLDVRSSVLLASLSERVRGDTEEALLDAVRPATNKLLQEAGLKPPEPTQPTTAASTAPVEEDGPRPLVTGLRIGGAVVAGGAVLAGLLAAAMWAVVGSVTAADVALSYGTGQRHAITATQAAASNVVFVGAALISVLSLVGLLTGAVVVGASGVLP